MKIWGVIIDYPWVAKSGAAQAKASAEAIAKRELESLQLQKAWAEADTHQLETKLEVAEQAVAKATAKAKAGLLSRVLG